MTEGLFILTIIFVACVVYVTINEPKEPPKSETPKPQPEAPLVRAKETAPTRVINTIKPTPVKPASIKKIIPTVKAKKSLRDPKTGEVATSYSNYRFTKRWIKEALVAEGLLEKIYKNDELNTDIEATIKAALLKLEVIKKYQP